MLIKISLFFVVVFTLLNCSSTKELNSAEKNMDWVNSPETYFPAKQYLTAIGSAGNVDSAQDRALGNIAKIFEVQITQMSVSEIKVMNKNGNESVAINNMQDTQTLTKQILKGSTIKKRAKNTTEQQWYALAVLKKSTARTILEKQMMDFDNKLQTIISQVPNSSKLNRVRILVLAQKIRKQIKVINEKYIVVSHATYVSKHDNYPFNQKLREARNSFSIKTTTDSGSMVNITKIIANALSDNGFITNNTSGDYLVSGNVETSDISKRNNWYWQNATISVYIADKNNNKLGSDSAIVRVSTGSKELLEQRLKQKIQQTIGEKLNQMLLRFSD
jgi:hypothetical protein